LNQITFVIPTYRLKEVCETVKAYDADAAFASFGEKTPIMVFDDSTFSQHGEHFHLLKKTETACPLLYVGPEEKTRFVEMLSGELGDDANVRLVLQSIFRPSYGGNRNFTLAYTVGERFFSSDDDMRPFGLVENSGDNESGDVICKGKYVLPDQTLAEKMSFNLVQAFSGVLGRKVKHLPRTYTRGDFLEDDSMDVETNTSKGSGLGENRIRLTNPGAIDPEAVVRIAQTFRTGTSDVDTMDYVDYFLRDPNALETEGMSGIYVISFARPAVTDKNWRFDCGVAGYDNSGGLPPFFPTRLRFEDYIYRLWIAGNQSAASAQLAEIQHHTRSSYLRPDWFSDLLNEEIANYLKLKLKETLTGVNTYGIEFGYDGILEKSESDFIFGKMRGVLLRMKDKMEDPAYYAHRAKLADFCVTMKKTMEGMHKDTFHKKISNIIDAEMHAIHSSLVLWPRIYEASRAIKKRGKIPVRRLR